METEKSTGLKARVWPLKGGAKGNLLAFADLTIGEAFAIKGIKVLRGQEGSLFVSFPAQKAREGDRYYDVAHPITPEAHRKANETILEAFRRQRNAVPAGYA